MVVHTHAPVHLRPRQLVRCLPGVLSFISMCSIFKTVHGVKIPPSPVHIFRRRSPPLELRCSPRPPDGFPGRGRRRRVKRCPPLPPPWLFAPSGEHAAASVAAGV